MRCVAHMIRSRRAGPALSLLTEVHETTCPSRSNPRDWTRSRGSVDPSPSRGHARTTLREPSPRPSAQVLLGPHPDWQMPSGRTHDTPQDDPRLQPSVDRPHSKAPFGHRATSTSTAGPSCLLTESADSEKIGAGKSLVRVLGLGALARLTYWPQARHNHRMRSTATSLCFANCLCRRWLIALPT